MQQQALYSISNVLDKGLGSMHECGFLGPLQSYDVCRHLHAPDFRSKLAWYPSIYYLITFISEKVQEKTTHS